MSPSHKPPVVIVGAGILGLWQALLLARAGFAVTVYETSKTPFSDTASRFAGAMLAPDCEGEAAPDIVRTLGHEGIKIWRDVYSGVVNAGSLVVAAPRDIGELQRYQNQTHGSERVDAERLGALEPDLGGRFSTGLFFADEAHVATPDAMRFLLQAATEAGAEFRFGCEVPSHQASATETDATGSQVIVNCRGLAARHDLADLRGVRGERIVIKSGDVTLSRPIRLLHPRHPLYVVPWGDGEYMIGATVIESEDDGPATVRSALELLGLAYSLCPAFGEAEILDIGAGVRPAYPNNVPGIQIRDGGQKIFVNGAFRHGFLLAPVLAEAVLGLLEAGESNHPLIQRTI
ncbi:MAG: FAD-dependent oxidoreductase [Hyphomicrobiaceae bacterium]